MFVSKCAAIASTALVLSTSTLFAATLTFEGTYSTVASVSGYNPSGGVPLETPLAVYTAPAGDPLGGGLYLTLGANQKAEITYQVLGQESGFFNYLVVEGANIPETDTVTLTVSEMNSSGYLDFGFASNRQYGTSAGATYSITNGGISEIGTYKLGLGTITSPDDKNFSLYSYFGDGTGDSDFDDIVVGITVQVSTIPVPASFPLLLAGLAGIGLIRRKRQG